jgi:2-C-methyl-D-erythritol 2,4-cyclodiphosphate synthase
VGIGYDSHRLQPGGPLRLGGIDIPHDREAVGHSDGDMLLHAVVDALLGAAALGDIGQMFPDTDPENRGRDSAEMVTAALDAVATLGWQIVNIDCIVFAQRPKLLPHRQTIRQRVADILGIEVERVGLQAKTGEGIGPVGREEAIAAQCVALLETANE